MILNVSCAYHFATVASPVLNLNVKASKNSVEVNWFSNEADVVTEYLVYYYLRNEEVITVTVNDTHDVFLERNASQRVYTVSVQALSVHLPSSIAGPVTARGQLSGVYA